MKTLAALLMAATLVIALPQPVRARSVGKLLKDARHNLNAGLLVDAKLAAEQVLRKKPDNQKAKWLLSVVHYRLAMQAKESGNPKHTADELGTAIALDPDEAYWHAALAQALAKQGDKEAAEKECSEAARLSPLDSGLAAGCGLNGKEKSGTSPAELIQIGPSKPAPDVTEPVPMHKPEPPYNKKAREAGFQGTVVLAIVIGVAGNVEQATVVKPLGLGLDQESLKMVRTWTFRPATRKGKPVRVRVFVEVSFRMYG